MRLAKRSFTPSNTLLILLAGILAGVLLLPALAQPGADASRTKSMRLGVSLGGRMLSLTPSQQAETLDDVARLGATWVRVDFDWSRLQPTAEDPVLWAALDSLVALAVERDLRVLPILAYTPAWARDPGCLSIHCPPSDPRTFAAFATAAAQRYAPQGVDIWELWNEPNAEQFWPSPNAARYAGLLAMTREAVTRVDRQAEVLFGSLAATNGASHVNSIDAQRFLDDVCALTSCEGLAGIGYHPYTYPRLASDAREPATPWRKISAAEPSLRGVLRRHGLQVPIWVTEWGAPTGGEGSQGVTEGRQAEIVRDGVEQAQRQPEIAALFVYTNIDLPDATGAEAHYGLRRSDGTAKPAWHAFAEAARAGS